ncbi:2884_t:CDS:2 [Acaulospora morrowiae]|uniref:2884_t:CDS:1 n=1 Tax=Acaulospora morrowiae TaxID=94023 RepID=A0A9N9DPN8_9GLOM|nr:2884_t:CDS:2 [Acaulospora morrowiae]
MSASPSTLAPSPNFTFTTTSITASASTSSSSTRWVRRLHHRQRNYRERNLLFSRMIHAAGGNENTGGNNNENDISSILSTTATIAPSTSSTLTLANSQTQEEDDVQNMYHHFRSKAVCKLNCAHCESRVCVRGMKAMLLADTSIELFSTDVPPLPYVVQLVGEDYMTKNCQCKIRDVACLTCGNVLGYHITQPCQQCMEACNNGHLWMFHTEEVASEERKDHDGRTLLWAYLPHAEKDLEVVDTDDDYEHCCR